MRIDTGQYMRMDQRMKLSPRMIQSMEILQLPALALEERIEQELEENPVLELLEHRGKEKATRDDDRPELSADEKPLIAHDADAGESTSDDFNRLADLSESVGESWQSNINESSEYRPTVRAAAGERDAKMDAMANTAARALPLPDQLLDQWRYVECDETHRAAGAHLIGFIDDDGYLRTPELDILNQAPTGMTRDDLDAALELLQRKLEPAGVGARDVQECLLLQIDALLANNDEDDDLDEAALDELRVARALVADHLKDIEMNRLPKIARQTGLTIEQINAAMARMRRLDPRPGRQVAPENAQVIVPDITIEYDPVNDRYVAGLNRGRQSSLRISPGYRKMSKDRTQEKDTREFLAKNMHNARWLIDSIEQRNNTVLRVVNAVLDVQRDFLDHGEQFLKPLPMIQVADQLGIHVGTVSRAVSEKHMQTPRGIYPLRMFFSGGTESDDGREMSWAAVQAKLQQIIDEEDKAKPFSDDALVEQLKSHGIEIARRTVAKYRQQLNIPPARRRKQFD